ncbi:hypothetical protein QBC40DRAFT_36038 [Triangularia verruculosa]|uniref:Uncharacterized protein n=1 Tax=Triangularia verruculosa TaxID=2587418 RepID=A0AAN7B217_9PEZI|nr:hypothetical protein QBC40DRAFT_36038 [Triangularia verruculosa]
MFASHIVTALAQLSPQRTIRRILHGVCPTTSNPRITANNPIDDQSERLSSHPVHVSISMTGMLHTNPMELLAAVCNVCAVRRNENAVNTARCYPSVLRLTKLTSFISRSFGRQTGRTEPNGKLEPNRCSGSNGGHRRSLTSAACRSYPQRTWLLTVQKPVASLPHSGIHRISSTSTWLAWRGGPTSYRRKTRDPCWLTHVHSTSCHPSPVTRCPSPVRTNETVTPSDSPSAKYPNGPTW